MTRAKVSASRSVQLGVGMIEILVAILVLAVGVLGYAGMQLFALKGAEDANNRVLATLIARDALERMLINANGTAVYFGNNWPSTPASPSSSYPDICMGGPCNADQLAAGDITQLRWLASVTLPNGVLAARVDCTGAPSPSCIVVAWNDETPDTCLMGNSIKQDASCLVMETIRP